MAATANATKLADLFDPQVVADEIDAKLINYIRLAPLARVDYTLVGRPGDKVTLPVYSYVGAAAAVAEGADIPIAKLTMSTTPVQVSKIGRAIEYTDEALLCGNANSVAEEAAKQVVLAVADKIEADFLTAMAALTAASTAIPSSGDVSPALAADMAEIFGEDIDGEKVLLCDPTMYARLMDSKTWLPASQLSAEKIVSGTVGEILGCQVVPTNRLASTNLMYVVKPGALALYLKRDTLVEFDRDIICETNYIKASKIFAPYVYNANKIAKITVTP